MTISKYLNVTFQFINEIEKKRDFRVQIGRTKSHAFNGRELSFSKHERNYLFHTTTKIIKGLQRHNELNVNHDSEITLNNNDLTLYVSGKHLLVNDINYTGFDEEIPKPVKVIEGKLTSISNRRISFYNKKRRYRIVLPLKQKVSLFGDFTGWGFSVDEIPFHETLVKIKILDNEYHFFAFTNKNKESYFIVDSLNSSTLDTFQRNVNSLLLSYAFLKGNYHGEHAYILTYDSSKFNIPVSILTQNFGGGIYNGFPVHSTKPYSITSIHNRIRYKKDNEGKIIGVNNSALNKYMVEFPSDSLSKLCELISNKGGVLRAVILFVSNYSTTLEMKVPTLFVALENVTKVIVGGDIVPPNLIDDEKIITEIKKVIKSAVKEIDKIKKDKKPEFKTEFDKKEYESNFSRITGKLNDFNRGTNNKKLKEPFDKFGYILTKEEEDLIFIHRNKFLHGDDYIASGTDYEYEFKELFHISMRLHKLISILILKASGYSGYILNNAKIYEYISEKKLKEPVFIKI